MGEIVDKIWNSKSGRELLQMAFYLTKPDRAYVGGQSLFAKQIFEIH